LLGSRTGEIWPPSSNAGCPSGYLRWDKLDAGYRIDLLVEDAVIVELKAVDSFHPIHEAQVISYLKLSGKKIGLLINFNVKLLTSGVRRLAN